MDVEVLPLLQHGGWGTEVREDAVVKKEGEQIMSVKLC